MKPAKLCRNLTSRSQQLYASISKALLSISNANDLKMLHSLIITFGLHKSVFLSGNLISRYSQFSDPTSSLLVFRVYSFKDNAFMWNTIIRAMTHTGLFENALELYGEMRMLQVKPDRYTFPLVIHACGFLMDFERGKVAHQHVLEAGFESDLYVNNSLIIMYSKHNKLGCARDVFNKMRQRDVVSWNSLLSGYSSNGYFKEALELFYNFRMEGWFPDSYSLSRVLLACGGIGDIEEGQIVHGLVEKIVARGNVILSNDLLSMYIKFDMAVDYWKIFNQMVDRDSMSWNIMIFGCCESGLYEESIRLFWDMLGHFKPDILTIISVLRACAFVGDLNAGRNVHEYMLSNGYVCDIMASNVIINMYAKCGELSQSREVFENMRSKDLGSWNSLVNGYIDNRSYQEAIELFRRMKRTLQPDFLTYMALLSVCKELRDMNFIEELHCDVIKQGFDSTQILGNALIDAYAKCEKMEDSLKQFEDIKVRDVFTWNSIISACRRSENNSLGFKMLTRMRMECVMPDEATFLSALPLCSYLIAKQQGKELHGCIIKLSFESHVPIANALIEMYSDTGSFRNSVLVFEHMKTRDIISWTTLITAYGKYGEGRRALKAFEDMKAAGIAPDHIAFVAIMYACSHSGLVQEGRALFEQMRRDYKIEPGLQHYACVVDLLSRAGLLAEAEEFIVSMPLQPDASIWGVLLSACRARGDMNIAERVSKRIIELNTNDPGYLVLASNVYAALGKWDKARTVRASLKARGLKKDSGCSWVQVRNKVYFFRAGDKFLEHHTEVKQLLDVLSALMAKEGYAADVKLIPYDIEEDKKLDMLCGHSERLAIAFALLHTKPGVQLVVMKNLRVCGDCHTVTKYISKIMHREILVRDANRFHLFKDGTCSCGDYW